MKSHGTVTETVRVDSNDNLRSSEDTCFDVPLHSFKIVNLYRLKIFMYSLFLINTLPMKDASLVCSDGTTGTSSVKAPLAFCHSPLFGRLLLICLLAVGHRGLPYLHLDSLSHCTRLDIRSREEANLPHMRVSPHSSGHYQADKNEQDSWA
ncbi:hypothetical protein E2C01_051315 [Portunus trituberculatus]|uniref:Uncharacterized protein n=1 Tax=Portunus trituberculatus TaxID=210409 RepID=A0A5B7GJ90_PORTR|nr:hypothetical protein [Portunus trituberculatus]